MLLLILSGCALFEVTHSLDELKTLNNVNKVKVFGRDRDEQGVWIEYQIKTIDDPQKVNAITEAFRAYADNWQAGRYHPYLPGRLTVVFYEGETPKASIMVVSRIDRTTPSEQISYFLSQEYGSARPIHRTDFQNLVGLLDVDENMTFYDHQKNK